VAICVVVLAALGVVLRLWLLAHDPIDADEAVVGLMARAIDHGHLATFFWGQTYGGVEPYVTAIGVAAFGLHAWVVNGTAAVVSVAAAVAVWWVVRLVTGSRSAAAVIAAVTWVWPTVDVWNATRESGFREVELVCLLTVLGATVLLQRDDRPALAWPLLGAAVGLGWWASPELGYVALPAAPVVVWAAVRQVRQRGRRALGPMATGVAAAVVTDLPWLVASVHDHFATLHVIDADRGPGLPDYADRLRIFFTHTLPMVLGARLPISGRWLGGRPIGPVLVVAALAVGVAGLVAAAWQVPVARVAVAAVVLYPFLEATAGPTAFWEDGRYGLYLVPLMAVAAGSGWDRLLTGLARDPADGSRRAIRHARRRHRHATARLVAAGTIVCALAATSSVAGIDGLTAVPGRTTTTGFAASPLAVTGHPDAVAHQVVDTLAAHHVTDLVAGYWVAYVLDVVGDGQVTATPAGRARSAAIAQAVARSPRSAWLFVGPTAADVALCGVVFENPSPEPLGLGAPTLEALLRRSGISFTTVPAGPMVAVVPASSVSPAWVLAHLAPR
jgi:hypothetical protein